MGQLPSVRDSIASDTTTSATYEDVDGLTVDLVVDDTSDILLTACITATGSTSAKAGWRLVFDDVNFLDLERQVGSEPGNISLVDLVSSKGAGTYTFKLQHKVDSGTLTTTNADIVAVSLHNGNGVVPAESDYVASDTVGNSWVDIAGLSIDITLSKTSHIWAMLVLNGYHSGSNKDTDFAINIDNTRMEEHDRDWSASGEYGCVTIVTLTDTEKTSGVYTVKAEWKGSGGSTFTGEDIKLVVIAGEADSGAVNVHMTKDVVASDTTTATSLEDIDGLSLTSSPEETAHILATVTLSTDVTIENTSAYTVIDINGVDSEVMERGHPSATRWGSIGCAERSDSPLAAGDYTIKAEWYTDAGNTLSGQNIVLTAIVLAGTAAENIDYEDRNLSLDVDYLGYEDRSLTLDINYLGYEDWGLILDVEQIGYLDRSLTLDIELTDYEDRALSLEVELTTYFDKDLLLDINLPGYEDRSLSLAIVIVAYDDLDLILDINYLGYEDRGLILDTEIPAFDDRDLLLDIEQTSYEDYSLILEVELIAFEDISLSLDINYLGYEDRDLTLDIEIIDYMDRSLSLDINFLDYLDRSLTLDVEITALTGYEDRDLLLDIEQTGYLDRDLSLDVEGEQTGYEDRDLLLDINYLEYEDRNLTLDVNYLGYEDRNLTLEVELWDYEDRNLSLDIELFAYTDLLFTLDVEILAYLDRNLSLDVNLLGFEDRNLSLDVDLLGYDDRSLILDIIAISNIDYEDRSLVLDLLSLGYENRTVFLNINKPAIGITSTKERYQGSITMEGN